MSAAEFISEIKRLDYLTLSIIGLIIIVLITFIYKLFTDPLDALKILAKACLDTVLLPFKVLKLLAGSGGKSGGEKSSSTVDTQKSTKQNLRPIVNCDSTEAIVRRVYKTGGRWMMEYSLRSDINTRHQVHVGGPGTLRVHVGSLTFEVDWSE